MLSRAQKVVDNAFGILAARWRIFLKSLEIQPKMVDKVVLAACCLHNMLFKKDFEPDNEWLSTLNPPRWNATHDALQIWEKFRVFQLKCWLCRMAIRSDLSMKNAKLICIAIVFLPLLPSSPISRIFSGRRIRIWGEGGISEN